MTQQFTHKQFLEKLYETNALYKNGELRVINKYVNSKIKVKVKYNNNYFLIRSNTLYLNNNLNLFNSLFKETFLYRQFNKIHNNKYKYPDFNYQNNKQKIKIICPKHGEFKQAITKHYQGQGCKKCTNENKKNIILLQNKILNLYFLEFYSQEEKFYKIGLTHRILKTRFRRQTNVYKYKKIKLIQSTDSQKLINFEYKIKQEYSQYQYIPNNKFAGYIECFSQDLLKINPDLLKRA